MTEAVEVEQIDRDAAQERLATLYEREAAQHDAKGYKNAAANQREKARAIRAGTAELHAIEAIIAARAEAFARIEYLETMVFGAVNLIDEMQPGFVWGSEPYNRVEEAKTVFLAGARALSPIKDRNNAG